MHSLTKTIMENLSIPVKLTIPNSWITLNTLNVMLKGLSWYLGYISEIKREIRSCSLTLSLMKQNVYLVKNIIGG